MRRVAHVKRAVYSIKRAVYSIKRAVCSIKRAVYSIKWSHVHPDQMKSCTFGFYQRHIWLDFSNAWIALLCILSTHVIHRYSIKWYHIYIFHPTIYGYVVQGGQDSYNALKCRSFFAKEPLIIGLFCRKWPVKIRHPMGLGRPVSQHALYRFYQWVMSHMVKEP